MKAVKEIVMCVVPFIVAAILMFPFVAIIGGGLDPFLWERNDRMFYFVCVFTFGAALLYRLMYVGFTHD